VGKVDPQRPSFSVIVPTYSRPAELAACLRALSALRYPRSRFEVIVVDDGSPCYPEDIVAAARSELDLQLVRTSRGGPAAARNAGAACARGTFLAFTDDDCVPAGDWLETLARRFETSPDQAIAGRKENVFIENAYSMASQLITDAACNHFNADPRRASFCSTSNLAVPASIFRELKGFDPTFRTAEDREFGDRLRRAGHPLTYAPEILVYHAHSLSLGALVAQHFHFGRGAFRFHEMSSRGRGSRLPRPDWRFYASLVRSPFPRERLPRAVWIATLILGAQAANLAGFVGQAIRDWRAPTGSHEIR
jgi:GT2 family glycosyltransferase